MRSCLYRGWVRHRRREAPAREFRYQLTLTCLDLAELDHVFDGRMLWSTKRPAWVTFRREDFLGDSRVPLAESVRSRVEQELGRRPAGNILLLSQLRYLGYSFNPVSFYYCYDDAGQLDAIVAEITNTPWKERHAYVLDARAARSVMSPLRFRFRKEFHVSPFLGMDYEYDWLFTEPDERLVIHMNNLQDGRPTFDATMSLERRPINGRELAMAIVREPVITLKTAAAIHWQALLLHLQRAPFFPHPGRAAAGARVAR